MGNLDFKLLFSRAQIVRMFFASDCNFLFIGTTDRWLFHTSINVVHKLNFFTIYHLCFRYCNDRCNIVFTRKSLMIMLLLPHQYWNRPWIRLFFLLSRKHIAAFQFRSQWIILKLIISRHISLILIKLFKIRKNIVQTSIRQIVSPTTEDCCFVIKFIFFAKY